MTEEITQKLKELLGKENFGLFLRADCAEEEYLCREALRLALEASGKKILSPADDQRDWHDKWQGVAKTTTEEPLPSKKLLVKIPKKLEVAEVSYDNNDDFLIFSVLAKRPVDISEIILEKAPAAADVIFLFAADEKELGPAKKYCILPARENVVMIAGEEKTLTDKIDGIISLMPETARLEKDVATLLFAALIVETGNFTKNSAPEVLALAAKLLKGGADKDRVKEILETQKPPSNKILGRALARSQDDPKLRTTWTFLPKKDFVKTDSPVSGTFMLTLAKLLRKTVPKETYYIVLWEEESKSIAGFAFSDDQNALRRLAGELGVGYAGDQYIKTPRYQSFSQAEINLRQLLKKFL